MSKATGSVSTDLLPKKRWRSQEKKYKAVVDHIQKCLESGGKTFDQIYNGLMDMGISDHYLSDVLRDLLLWEHTIEQREERVYTLKTKKAV